MKQMMDSFYSLQFNPRSLCPVCGSRKWQGCTCTACGYEVSRDYSTWRTLGEIPAGTESLEAKQDKLKREEEEKQAKWKKEEEEKHQAMIASVVRELTKVSQESQAKLQTAEQNYAELRKTHDIVMDSYRALQEENAGLKKECSDRINERKKLREEYRALDKKYEELQNTCRELQRQNEKLQAENDRFRAEQNARISEPVKQKKSFWGQLFGTETQEAVQTGTSVQAGSGSAVQRNVQYEAGMQAGTSGQRNDLRDQLRSQLSSGAKEITIGQYPQSEDGTVSPIQWQVLERSDKGVLVISKYILDSKAYNAEYKDDVVWENCDLRRWLANDFRRQAFNEKELGCIRTVTNENNVAGKDSGGRETEDRIFLLSRKEAETYLPDKAARICKGTGYAVKARLWVRDGNGASLWWLRSVGSSGGRAMDVSNDGGFYDNHVYSVFVGVRPALWLNL